MSLAIRARHAVWGPIMENVKRTIGARTPLYQAALRARLGKDPGGERFATLAARLPSEDRRRLEDSIDKLDSERAQARCAT